MNSTRSYPKITVVQLLERLSEASSPLLLDVRLEDDFQEAHLPGAKNNCVFEVAFLDRMNQVAPDLKTPICVYGSAADSLEAGMAAEKLCRAGYTTIMEFSEGIEGWKSAHQSLEGQLRNTRSSHAHLTGTRQIDLTESRVEWVGRNLLNKHWGSLGLKSGTLQFEEGQLIGGEFVMDMQAITCEDLKGNPLHDVLIAHLRSDDFFDAEVYPHARFVITKTTPLPGASVGAPNLAIRGDLTLKDVTTSLDFVAVAGFTAEEKPAAQATFAIDRTRWNVLYGSGKFFRRLAGHLVNDLIEIQLRIVGT